MQDNVFLGSPSDPSDLRAAGWTVAVHNDYRQDGQFHTFWIFTKDNLCYKGEGLSDAAALDQIRKQVGLPCSDGASELEAKTNRTVRALIADEADLPSAASVPADTAYVQYLNRLKLRFWYLVNGQWVSKIINASECDVNALKLLPGSKTIPLDDATKLQVAGVLLQTGSEEQKLDAIGYISNLPPRF